MERSVKYIICIITILVSIIINKNVYSFSWQNTEYIIDSFFEVGLGTEHGASTNRSLRKWKKPIRVYVEHQIGDKALHNQLLDHHIQQLNSITQLDIQRVKEITDANVFYYFTRQSNLAELVKTKVGTAGTQYLHGAICLANIKTDKNSNITSAHIFIPVDQARMHGKLVACIVEEITQALGLVRDSEQVFPSIFNDKTRNALLTGLDEILLRLLSENSVKAGMSESQLRPVLKRLLQKYKSQGLIQTADYRVQEGDLYKMLGYQRTKRR